MCMYVIIMPSPIGDKSIALPITELNSEVKEKVQEDVQSHTTDDELSDDMPPHNEICMHGNTLGWKYIIIIMVGSLVHGSMYC